MTGAIFWTDTVRLPGKQTGVIGLLPTEPGAESRAWITRAARTLSAKGCNRVLGPIERSCWGLFGEGQELVAGHPPLPQEPPIFPGRISDWRACGFRPWRSWTTWLLPSTLPADRRLETVRRQLGWNDIEIRRWTPADREELKPGMLRMLHGWEGREPLYVHPTMGWARRWLGERIADFEPMLSFAAWQRDRLIGVIGTEMPPIHDPIGIVQGLLLDPEHPQPGLGLLMLYGVAQQAEELRIQNLYWRQAPDASNLEHSLRRLGTPIRRYTVFRWREPRPR